MLEGCLFVTTNCTSCLTPTVLAEETLIRMYSSWSEKMDTSQKYLRAVVLTDCANAYTSICGISAPPLGKSTRLLLAHIRDNLPTVGVSYSDAIFNLADVGTKLMTSKDIWMKFIACGEFNISFLGRRLSREAKTEIEQGDRDTDGKKRTNVDEVMACLSSIPGR